MAEHLILRTDVKRPAVGQEGRDAQKLLEAAGRVAEGKVLGVLVISSLDGSLASGEPVTMTRLVSEADVRPRCLLAITHFAIDRRDEVPRAPPRAG